jgi:hypothetical protein
MHFLKYQQISHSRKVHSLISNEIIVPKTVHSSMWPIRPTFLILLSGTIDGLILTNL